MNCLITLILILNATLYSQNIESIVVKGNKKTQDYIILREIKQKINTNLNENNISEDKNRIYNLGLFSDVDIQIIDNSYVITVSEAWYIWPFPIIKYDHRSNQFSYGGGLVNNNFRGRDEEIAFGTTFGSIKEYFLWYANPWIGGNHNSLELMIYNESSEHFIYNIIEKDKGFFIGSGFYKGDNKKIKLGLNYNNKLIEEDLSVSDKSVEPKYLNQLDFRYIRFIIEYKYDTRDIYIDPHSGILFNIELDNMIGFDQTQNIYAIEIFFNIYKNLHDGIIRYNSIEPVFKYKLFSRTQLSNQDLPIFRKEYIAGQGYVRGYSAIPYNNIIDNPKKRIEVDNFLINTFEIQSTIIKRKEYINKMELGLDIILFADWGVGYNLNKFINFNNSLIGYGVGAKIFIMGGVLKLDYAFNPYGGGKLHLFD